MFSAEVSNDDGLSNIIVSTCFSGNCTSRLQRHSVYFRTRTTCACTTDHQLGTNCM